MTELPAYLWYAQPPFEQDYSRLVARGWQILAHSDIAIVGLARNCASQLSANLERVLELRDDCRHWRLHIETNDNQDGTDQVLRNFCSQYRNATFASQRLDRPQFSAEFAGRRTEALAEYRTTCQQWIRDTCPAVDYVLVYDFDAWGGWNQDGLAHAVAELDEHPGASGMASVSLVQLPALSADEQGNPVRGPQWLHYDAWALRLNSFWDDYTAGQGGWKHQWLPPVGSPVVPVCSAFGGMAVYRTTDYLAGKYTGEDCEHVTFHRTLPGQMYLDPAMRTLMHWVVNASG